MSHRREKVVLIDAYTLIHRAFYALPPLHTSGGEPTNAVLGFANMLLALLDEERPEYVAVAFDRSGPTFRDEMFDEYKAQRPSMPEELRPQIARAEQFLEAMNIPVFGRQGYEADDMIGTLARQAREKGLDVLIVTGDRDLLQLVDERVHVLVTRRGIRDMQRMDREGVIAALGVPPERVTDLKGLMGDASDNIPGVPRIGPKTAVKLLQEYGTLENVLANAHAIKGQVGENLRAYADQARLSKELSIIKTDAPARFDEDALRRRPPNMEALTELAAQLEFRTLLERIRKQAGAAEESGGADGKAAAGSPPEPAAVGAEVVREAGALERACALLARAEEPLVVAALASDEDAMRADIIGVLLAAGSGRFYVPLGHQGAAAGPQLPWDQVRAALTPLLEDGAQPKWCHDAKRLRTLLRRAGTELLGVTVDTMLASYLVNPEGSHDLPDASMRWLDRFVPTWKQRLGDAGAGRKAADAAALPPEAAAAGLAEEADVIRELAPALERRLRADGLWELYEGIELPLVDVLLDMEMQGVRIDVDYLARLSGELDGQIQELAASIYELAGQEFNINSPKQLSAILFDKLGLPVVKRTKTGPSTDQEVLETLAEQHELPRKLLEYRQLTKLKSTYIDALPALVHPETGRVHTHFNQTVAATGRLSSTNPNLQNIPVRTEQGRRIRKAFIPSEPGWVLLKADYSQIELRVLAHISGDETLIEAFRQGEDIHTRTAAEVFGLDPAEVTPERREAAKAINFGIVYGISSFGLAKGTGLSQEDAQRYIDAYFARYPGVKQYIEKIKAVGREQGYVTTLFNRRRYLPDLKSRNFARRSFAERTAMNTPIQGSAADIIKLAMVAAHRRLKEEGLQARLLLQVHDELVLELPREEVPRAAALIRDCMANVVELAVPLVVDIEQGPNWLETERVPGHA
ncbi:MAG: DNA polymerase I [Limnochordales bacterium]